MAASDTAGDTGHNRDQDATNAGTDELDKVAPTEPEIAADLGETGAADGDVDMAPEQDGASGEDVGITDDIQADAAKRYRPSPFGINVGTGPVRRD